MFAREYGRLSALARPERLSLSARMTAAARKSVEARADMALGRDLPAMPLSRRLSDPEAYRRVQQGRRQVLEALVLANPTGAALARATDAICMIVEEASWSENAKGAPFDDDQHPEIDFQCAETLALLAWTHRELGERLGPRVSAKLTYEARRRVFSPFLAHGDYPFMRFAGPGSGRFPRPLCVLSDILLSAILLETDAARRDAVARQALRLLDQAVQDRERRVMPLADELAETAAVADLCALLALLTRREVDLTGEYPPSDWLDRLLFCWLEGSCFADPATGDMHPPLAGRELFRVGLMAEDQALVALGARLHATRDRPSSTVTGRLLDAVSFEALLSAEAGEPPRLKHAATPGNRVMLSRLGGMTCAMHTGGGRGNAGSLLLFAGESPVLVEVPGHASLPRIAGLDPLDDPAAEAPEAAFGDDVCPADFEVEPGRELMSVDLTRAWPARAAARACQRTVMALRAENALRLVDAFDLESPAELSFRFITPQRPERLMEGVRLGPVLLNWADALTCDIQPLGLRFPSGDPFGDALYQITLIPRDKVSRGFFTFSFTAAR